MKRRLPLLGLAAALVALSVGRVAAGDVEGIGALGLPHIDGGITVYHSPAAEAEAKVYAATLDKAVGWYRARLDWRDPVVMAVLDAKDFARVTEWPYPVPHAAIRTGVVIMPDRIDDFPGFDRWDLEPVGLNAALTLHEIGHVIAFQTGIWSSSAWVNELVANVFLAGYARAEAPEFAGLLGGVPPRFADAGVHTSLDDFDALYASIGLANYAWFQFRFAAIADHLVQGEDFAAVVDGLRREFPADGQDDPLSVAETLRRLDRIHPGISALAADLQAPSALPENALAPCRPEPPVSEHDTILIIENRSATPLIFTSRADVEFAVGLAMLRGEAEQDPGQERVLEAALADFRYAETLRPGERLAMTTLGAGTQVHVKDGGCFILPAGSSRFVWTGG